MTISYHSKDILLKYLADSLGGDALQWMGIDDVQVVSAIPTEMPKLEIRGEFLDTAFLTDTGELLHIEYQSTRESDLYRFLQYDAYLTARHKRPVRTVILYHQDVLQAPERLDAGYLQYRVENVFLKAKDGLQVLDRIERHIASSEWTIHDRLDLAFLPFMGHLGVSEEEMIHRTVDVVYRISDKREQDHLAALILGLSSRTMSEQEQLQLIELLKGTNLVNEMLKLEHERGREEGIQLGMEMGLEKGLEKGMEDGKIVVAESMLADGADLETIKKYTGLSKEKIESLRNSSH